MPRTARNLVLAWACHTAQKYFGLDSNAYINFGLAIDTEKVVTESGSSLSLSLYKQAPCSSQADLCDK